MKIDSHAIIMTNYYYHKKKTSKQETACAWHTRTLATYIKATYDSISLFTAIATAGLLCADHTDLIQGLCHSDQPTALQFMVDVPFVIGALSPGAGTENRTQEKRMNLISRLF